jgi:hypothetical protein
VLLHNAWRPCLPFMGEAWAEVRSGGDSEYCFQTGGH